MSRYSEMCKQVAAIIMAAGFTVYLSRSEEYGFFTDAEEKVIVSFGEFSYMARFSGNYIGSVRSQGSGWGICDVYPLSEEQVCGVFQQAHYPPAWATGGNAVTLASVEHHLKMFPASGFHKLDRTE